ncbi:MAG: FGGY family carbohydrate kinase [Gemmataceae bacterium]
MIAYGLDIGSSSIKGAVLDLATSTIHPPVLRPFPAPVRGLPSKWIEIDPFAVIQATGEVLSLLSDQSPNAELLCVSAQMGGLILLEEQGNPLTNYLSWRDQRTLDETGSGSSFLEKVREHWITANYLSELGQELQPGSTTALLGWLQSQGQLPRHATPATIGDFVVSHLVGHLVPMHATHAIGMLDLRNDTWHRPALDLLKLNALQLPELLLSERCVGETRLAGRKLQVFGSYGDHQCALRGAGLLSDELSLNISTGSQVSRRSTRFVPGPYQSRKYFFGDNLDTVTHLPAGRSLNVLVDLLTELARIQGVPLQNPWDTINQLVSSVPDTDLHVDLSFFRTPLGERGRIDHISTENLSVGTLFHAAFRAMADNYAQIANRFCPPLWNSIVLSGGLTQNAPRLRALLKERFSAPLRESKGEETLAGLLDIALASVPSPPQYVRDHMR